jgi:hypothetical protein
VTDEEHVDLAGTDALDELVDLAVAVPLKMRGGEGNKECQRGLIIVRSGKKQRVKQCNASPTGL